jgi:hypothetical protein
MNIKSIFKKPVVIALFCLSLMLCAYKVYPWGAFLGIRGGALAADTHLVILQEAYKLLLDDPAMRQFNRGFPFYEDQQVRIENILDYEGVYGDPLTLSAYGPGPDADGSTYYSSHWFNPLTGQGHAPQAASDQYLAYINAVVGNNIVDEHALRGVAWSAHFIADMFVPYHIVGIPLSEAIARMNSRNFYLSEEEVGPLFLYSPTPPAQNNGGIFKFPQEVIRNWWRKGWGVDNEFSKAYGVFWKNRMDAGGNDQKNPIDWFDPWYWNGLPARTLMSSHASYESNAHQLWMQGPGHEKDYNRSDYYDPLWENAQPDYSRITPSWQAQTWQVQDFAAKIARRTRENIETYWKYPTLGIHGAIEAVYTLWRSAFSALETKLRFEPDPDRPDAYFIIANVHNSAFEDCQKVQVTLTIQKGDEIVLENSQVLTGPLNRRNPEDVKWHVQIDFGSNETWSFLSEIVGTFVETPDLQYAHDLRHHQTAELDEEVEEEYGYTEPLTYNDVRFNQGERAFADRVAGFRAGEGTKDGYNNPNNSLGRPDNDRSKPKAFTALGHEGVLVVGFSNVWLVDGQGPDLYVFEIGPMIEPFRVEISSDGGSWIDLGVVRGQPSTLDIAGRGAPGQKYSLVRITDAGSHMSGSPYAGADIDAVGAINARKK